MGYKDGKLYVKGPDKNKLTEEKEYDFKITGHEGFCNKKERREKSIQMNVAILLESTTMTCIHYLAIVQTLHLCATPPNSHIMQTVAYYLLIIMSLFLTGYLQAFFWLQAILVPKQHLLYTLLCTAKTNE